MKKIISFLLSLFIVMVLGGCGSSKPLDNGKMKVVATVYPVYEVAKQVGGDKISLTMLVPLGAEPHDWEPTAGNLKEIGNAKVFLYSGAGLEPMDKLLTKEVAGKVKTCELSAGLELLPGTGPQGKGTMATSSYDPHVWLDPVNVYREVDRVVAAFSEADPANKKYYEENGRKFQKQLKNLDEQYKETLKNKVRKNFVSAHEAFGYLAKRYGLVQLGIMGMSHESEPTPETMAAVVTFIKNNHIPVIYTEANSENKVATAIAKETGVQIKTLNTIETITEKQQAEGLGYIKLMEENLKALASGVE